MNDAVFKVITFVIRNSNHFIPLAVLLKYYLKIIHKLFHWNSLFILKGMYFSKKLCFLN
ncbi:MAG: hypothetical protein LBR40_06535 [Bacilli bacterium]|jgi:hypothetical protein|nr:hypothetical protein [Bacilli bacterium]